MKQYKRKVDHLEQHQLDFDSKCIERETLQFFIRLHISQNMFKLLCLFVVVAAVSAMPRAPEWHPAPGPAPMGRLVKRDVQQPFPKQMPNIEENAKEEGVAVAGEDDMDKAETFGFGYHHYYAYPRYYYPSYHYGYYPSYHYGYYW